MKIERRLYTEEQIVIMSPNQTKTGIVLSICEADMDDKHETRLYLTFNEAASLADQIDDFIISVKK